MLSFFSSRFFLGAAQRRLFLRGVPVLTYHSVAVPPAGSRDPFLYVKPERFAGQMEHLQRLGFSSGSLDEVGGLSDNDAKKVVITFDDGYVNVLQNALATLTRHNFSSIQFIVAGLIGTRNEWDVVHGEIPAALMDTGQIREWLAAGQQIGSHGLTHRNLAKLSAGDAREQIFGSKKKLEDLFGIPIRHFCYPHGSWTPVVRDLVAEAGYETACTTAFGVNTAATSRFQLNRITPLSAGEFFAKATHRLARRIKPNH